MTSMPPPGKDSGPDGSWSYSAPAESANLAPAGTATLDPFSQRLLKVAAGLSALLILVVAFAWLHGSDATSLNPIAEGAVRTQEQPGSRIAMRGIYSLPDDKSMTMHGSGVYNAQTGRSRLAMELTMPGVAAIASYRPPPTAPLGTRARKAASIDGTKWTVVIFSSWITETR